MTPAEFKKKWAKVTAKETSAYQSHFDDVCRLLKIAPPLEADPKGEFFCFQKRVVKDAELFAFDDDGKVAETPESERGFADVWKRGCFAWEYKGKKKNLETAYAQLLRYREALENPPLLVVCDFDRFIIRTNFNGTVQETHEFTNAQIDDPKNLRLLRNTFSDPDFLKPQRTTAEVTKTLATQIAGIAKSLQGRESRELADAKTRAQMNYAQRKNLRIARFLNRMVFCFFAEDTGLLPKNLFSEIAKSGLDDPKDFALSLESLFAVMAKGGKYGNKTIRHFNGHLFEDSTVFELTPDELRALADASDADWQFIQPSIMGTLFERALEPEQRSQLGAHYTSEEDIRTLVEPVLMAPLRSEWRTLKGKLAAVYVRGKGTPAQRDQLAAFQKKLAGLSVLDPACGSGNFLYVALQSLLDLEKEVITYATQIGFKLAPLVSVQQLRALEINPYAFELAQVSVQIGFLQWRRDNGFDNDRSPVLANLDGFQNKDALLNDQFRVKPKNLKEAQAEEHSAIVPLGASQVEIGGTSEQGELAESVEASAKPDAERVKVYYERGWPACDIIVSNPPFLGDKFMRGELGDDYVKNLRKIYGKRIPGQSDLCCYWFEKAREHIFEGKCSRAGLIATQGIRGGANRKVLERIKASGGIFFAESDRDWILAGANVHVSMVGFDDGTEKARLLDGRSVEEINANLSAVANVTDFQKLKSNEEIGFIGVAQKAPFDISEEQAVTMLSLPNPHGRPNSDVLIPICNAEDITRRRRGVWNVDFGLSRPLAESQLYEAPFAEVQNTVYPLRIAHREARQTKYWWLFARPCPDMRKGLHGLQRFLATPRVSKHRVFAWLSSELLCDSAVVAFARDDDYFFGVMQSRLHEVWALKLGTRLETRPRYTPTTCFETFPLPNPSAEEKAAIAEAAKELNALRENWLNPPEWTTPRTLEFPGALDGPWKRFVHDADARGIGTVRYPLTEPRDTDCAAKLAKRTLTNLYNERPAWLANAHAKLDAAVVAAYGWPADMSDDEILSRLLELNLARAAAEKVPVFKPAKKKSTVKDANQMELDERK
jgi:type II restriction/modification system DNA methylase subunit YeeA